MSLRGNDELLSIHGLSHWILKPFNYGGAQASSTVADVLLVARRRSEKLWIQAEDRLYEIFPGGRNIAHRDKRICEYCCEPARVGPNGIFRSHHDFEPFRLCEGSGRNAIDQFGDRPR